MFGTRLGDSRGARSAAKRTQFLLAAFASFGVVRLDRPPRFTKDDKGDNADKRARLVVLRAGVVVLRGDAAFAALIKTGKLKPFEPMPDITVLEGTVERLKGCPAEEVRIYEASRELRPRVRLAPGIPSKGRSASAP